MMGRPEVLSGQIVSEDTQISITQICRGCAVQVETVTAMVEEGILDPRGDAPERWSFAGSSLRRVRTALRLQQDLGVNLAGAALALDLLDELERLRTRLPGGSASTRE